MSFTPNYTNKYESILVEAIASCLWIQDELRLFLFNFIGQMFFLYYKVMGAYSNPEIKLQKLIDANPISAREKKTAIVTGANTGMGFETARVLAKAGYKVILACRDENKAQKAIKEICTKVKGCDLEFSLLDLSSLASVRKFTKEYLERGVPLNLFINNAAVFALPDYVKTKDGFEMQYQVNYLSPFLLTYLLAPRLKEACDSKIINLSSIAHFGAGDCDLSSINNKSSYSQAINYCKSKASGYMSTISFQERLGSHGVQVFAAYPGLVATEVWRNVPILETFITHVNSALFKTPLQGALTTLRLALTPNSVLTKNPSSRYFADELPMQPYHPTQDTARQERLWQDTCKTLNISTDL